MKNKEKKRYNKALARCRMGLREERPRLNKLKIVLDVLTLLNVSSPINRIIEIKFLI